MSNQLAISATASVLAMTLFVLGYAGDGPALPASHAQGPAWHATGAATQAAAPTFDRFVPALFANR